MQHSLKAQLGALGRSSRYSETTQHARQNILNKILKAVLRNRIDSLISRVLIRTAKEKNFLPYFHYRVINFSFHKFATLPRLAAESLFHP